MKNAEENTYAFELSNGFRIDGKGSTPKKAFTKTLLENAEMLTEKNVKFTGWYYKYYKSGIYPFSDKGWQGRIKTLEASK